MRTLVRSFILGVALLAATGCHHMKSDYPKYVAEHPAVPALGHTDARASYSIGQDTLAHRVSIRSFAAGWANKWIVEFGAMLEQQLESAEARAAFASLAPTAQGAGDYALQFDLLDYSVQGFAAQLSLRVQVKRGGSELLLDKTYRADGHSHAGKVLMGGAFTMRSALQGSTKQAVDSVLRELLVDLERVTRPTAVASATPAAQ